MGNQQSAGQEILPDQYQEGDKVKTTMQPDMLAQMQTSHGGYLDAMKHVIGEVGVVKEIDADGDVVVVYSNGRQWCFNPAVLTMVTPSGAARVRAVQSIYSAGDIVRTVANENELKKLQEGFGGWVEPMSRILNTVGIVKKVVASKVVRIYFGGVSWNLNPKAVKKLSPADLNKLNNPFGTTPKYVVGDIIQVSNDNALVKRNQPDHGEWIDEMSSIIGCCGYVKSLFSDGDLRIKVKGRKWTINPKSVRKLVAAPSGKGIFSVGDKVTILSDKNEVTTLQQGHGEWISSMEELLGKEGHVKTILPNGDLRVKVCGNVFTFNPAAVTKVDPQAGRVGMEQLLQLLAQSIAEGSDDSSDDEAADTLFKAAKEGNQTVLKKALEKRGLDIDKKIKGTTALQTASNKGHLETVRTLLDKGADYSITDSDGDTALHFAVHGHRTEVVKLLLERGAKINALNNKKLSPLHLAVIGELKDIIKVLLVEGADRNTKDDDGDTPLHDAIYKNNIEILELLLKKGASVKEANNKGFTALHHAAIRDNSSATKLILEYHPETVDVPKEDGFTALHVAVINNHPEVVETLLRTGSANPNCVNQNGQTPLHVAAVRTYIEPARILIERSRVPVDLNAKDKDGDTPLHEACSRIGQDSTRLLLAMHPLLRDLADSKVDPKVAEEIANLLLEKGADLTIKNSSNKTALDVCNDEDFKKKLGKSISRSPSAVAKPAPSSSSSGAEARKPVTSTKNDGVNFGELDEDKDLTMDYKRRVNDLTVQVEGMKENTVCQICFDSERNMVFQCGHMYCESCSAQVAQCPTCREPITNRIKVYT